MRILPFAVVLAYFGTASAQAPLASQKSTPVVKPAPSVAASSADLVAAKRKELANIDAELALMKTGKDSIGDLNQEQQKRMQALMARRDRVAEQLGEALKKASDTQSSIVSNIK